jgi:hypothetical protein
MSPADDSVLLLQLVGPRIMLDEGVVAALEDIDLCMILDAERPFHLGGITPCLDRTGVAAKVNGVPFRR